MLFSKNCSNATQQDLSNILGIKTSSTFGKYLGFHMFHSTPKSFDFYFLLDNMHSKLVSWKTKFLNMAGRTTLAKASLVGIPNHVIQINLLPTTMHKRINRIQRNFLWGTTEKKNALGQLQNHYKNQERGWPWYATG